jgi:hypothetical protein|tara:strand:- start:425 stop:607 length:183 start_codon:yes stop_codon:yes gene_type:complete
MKDKLKEFRLTRHTTIEEECFVEAENWEDAEQMGYLEEQDWEFVYDHGEIEAEEIENDKA